MDNHIYLLMKVNNEDLASIMKGIAVHFASFYNWKYQRVGHVFQDRFRSEAIEDDRYLLAAVRYIHNNPVKASISVTPEGYMWSSYSQYLRYDDQGWIETGLVLGMISEDRITAIKEFEKFSREPDDAALKVSWKELEAREPSLCLSRYCRIGI
jgi:putative transposase